MSKTIKTYPAIGWVRANNVANSELLQEINELRKENAILKAYKEKQNFIPDLELADFDAIFSVNGRYKSNSHSTPTPFILNISWREIFTGISPYLMAHPFDNSVKRTLSDFILHQKFVNYYSGEIDENDFQTIKLQLLAYKLVNITYEKSTNGQMMLFWSLTELGRQKMIELRTVKK